MQLKAISWNIFHGRDFPPDPALRTWRSRLLRVTERNRTHVQVNRDLRDEFCHLLATAEWDVALLQECPPRWREALAETCEAEAHMALTSRNSLGRLRALAASLNPDLVTAAEGGSNLTLVRPASSPSPVPYVSYADKRNSGAAEVGGGLGGIVERRELAIRTGRPERRTMAFTRVTHDTAGVAGGDSRAAESDLCVANLHASNDRPDLATEEVLHAAAAATRWAGDSPLLFGGDLNLRPAETPAVFDELREHFGLTAPTGPEAIDHLLVRNLEIVEPPHPWPAERRELREDGRALRLSDHAPVEARFATPDPR